MRDTTRQYADTFEPLLAAHDLEIEKGVIVEEIKSVEDSPEELVEDLFQQRSNQK